MKKFNHLVKKKPTWNFSPQHKIKISWKTSFFSFFFLFSFFLGGGGLKGLIFSFPSHFLGVNGTYSVIACDSKHYTPKHANLKFCDCKIHPAKYLKYHITLIHVHNCKYDRIYRQYPTFLRYGTVNVETFRRSVPCLTAVFTPVYFTCISASTMKLTYIIQFSSDRTQRFIVVRCKRLLPKSYLSYNLCLELCRIFNFVVTITVFAYFTLRIWEFLELLL